MSKEWTHLQAFHLPSSISHRQLYLTTPQGRISGKLWLHSQKEALSLYLVIITRLRQQVLGPVVQLAEGHTAIWSSLESVPGEATLPQKRKNNNKKDHRAQ